MEVNDRIENNETIDLRGARSQCRPDKWRDMGYYCMYEHKAKDESSTNKNPERWWPLTDKASEARKESVGVWSSRQVRDVWSFTVTTE
jgi:hypothetical protein